MGEIKRCPWATDPHSIEYHDNEWGKINQDENHLFELLVLEGFQAGLNWATILRKREAFKAAFDDFDPKKVASYTEEKITELMKNEEIIRNSLKIKAAITNAKAFLKVQKDCGSFSKYIWSFTDGNQIINNWQNWENVPAKTELSEKVSKDLKKRGFKFVGPVIVYSYLGAIGIINDHLVDCSFR